MLVNNSTKLHFKVHHTRYDRFYKKAGHKVTETSVRVTKFQLSYCNTVSQNECYNLVYHLDWT